MLQRYLLSLSFIHTYYHFHFLPHPILPSHALTICSHSFSHSTHTSMVVLTIDLRIPIPFIPLLYASLSTHRSTLIVDWLFSTYPLQDPFFFITTSRSSLSLYPQRHTYIEDIENSLQSLSQLDLPSLRCLHISSLPYTPNISLSILSSSLVILGFLHSILSKESVFTSHIHNLIGHIALWSTTHLPIILTTDILPIL